jgi:hypothetical protein
VRHLHIIIPATIALTLIWSGVAYVLHETEFSISSPEKVLDLMLEAPWMKAGDKSTPATRKPYLEEVARNINLLDLEQAQQVREDALEKAPDFFLFLGEEEQKWFMKLTMEQRSKPLLKAFNNLSMDERRTMLSRSRAELKKSGRDNGSMEKLIALDPDAFENILKVGITNYYESADAEKRRHLAPLIEEMQVRLQGGRRR